MLSFLIASKTCTVVNQAHRPYRMEVSSAEDLQAKLSSTQLQLGAVQRNYDAMSGAHL